MLLRMLRKILYMQTLIDSARQFSSAWFKALPRSPEGDLLQDGHLAEQNWLVIGLGHTAGGIPPSNDPSLRKFYNGS